MIITKTYWAGIARTPCPSDAGSSLVGQPGSPWFFLSNILLCALSFVVPGSALGRFITWQYSLTNICEVGRGKDALLGDVLDFEMLQHGLFWSFYNHRLLQTKFQVPWEANFFKRLGGFICFHSIQHTNYHSQKSCPHMVFKAADSQFLFTRLCTLPIPLALKLMVATLRSSEIIGLGGKAIQFITSCQQYHCCFMTGMSLTSC